MQSARSKWWLGFIFMMGAVLAGCGGESDPLMDVEGTYQITLSNRTLTPTCPAEQFLPDGTVIGWTVVQRGNVLTITDTFQNQSYEGILESDGSFEASFVTTLFSQNYAGKFAVASVESGLAQIVIPSITCTASYELSGPRS